MIQRERDSLEDKYKNQIESLKKEKEEAVNKLNHDHNEKLGKEVDNLTNTITNLKLEMDSKKYTHKEQINEYDRMLQEEVEKRKKLNEQLSVKNDQLDKYSNELENLKTKLTKETEENKKYNAECHRLNGELHEVQAGLKDLSNSFKNLNEKYEHVNSESHNQKLEISKQNDEISDLKFRLKDANIKIDEHKNTIKALTDKNTSLTELLEIEKNKVFEKSISSQKEFMTFREECNEKVDKEAKQHRETLSRLHAKDLENKSLESKFESLNDKLNTTKQFLVAKENENLSLNKLIAEHNEEFKNKEIKLNSVQAELREKIRNIKLKATKAIQQAIKKINEFKFELNILKKHCNQDKLKQEMKQTFHQVTAKVTTVMKDMK